MKNMQKTINVAFMASLLLLFSPAFTNAQSDATWEETIDWINEKLKEGGEFPCGSYNTDGRMLSNEYLQISYDGRFTHKSFTVFDGRKTGMWSGSILNIESVEKKPYNSKWRYYTIKLNFDGDSVKEVLTHAFRGDDEPFYQNYFTISPLKETHQDRLYNAFNRLLELVKEKKASEKF